MKRANWRFVLLMALPGCALPMDERFKDYNDDGVQLYQHGNYREASESFQAALTLRPGDIVLLYNLGECHDRQGDRARAEDYYRRCLALAPNHEQCNHSYLDLLVRTGRKTDAQNWVNNWLAREPGLASPYAEDGWLFRLAGDLPRAQARLQQALALDPHDARALTEMGLVYEQLQLPDRALVLYERILARDPHQEDISNHVNFLLARGAKPPHPN